MQTIKVALKSKQISHDKFATVGQLTAMFLEGKTAVSICMTFVKTSIAIKRHTLSLKGSGYELGQHK
jgi:hypothetical protein